MGGSPAARLHATLLGTLLLAGLLAAWLLRPSPPLAVTRTPPAMTFDEPAP